MVIIIICTKLDQLIANKLKTNKKTILLLTENQTPINNKDDCVHKLRIFEKEQES